MNRGWRQADCGGSGTMQCRHAGSGAAHPHVSQAATPRASQVQCCPLKQSNQAEQKAINGRSNGAHLDVDVQLAVGHGHVAHSHTQAQHLLQLVLDGRADLVRLRRGTEGDKRLGEGLSARCSASRSCATRCSNLSSASLQQRAAPARPSTSSRSSCSGPHPIN